MFKTVNQTVKLERMSICKKCESFQNNISTCRQCGCYMPAKATFASSECPAGKWTTAPAGENLINKIEEMILESWNKQ